MIVPRPPGRNAPTLSQGSIRREDRVKSFEVWAPPVGPPPYRDQITNNRDLGSLAGSVVPGALRDQGSRRCVAAVKGSLALRHNSCLA